MSINHVHLFFPGRALARELLQGFNIAFYKSLLGKDQHYRAVLAKKLEKTILVYLLTPILLNNF
jgi:hypothetical protein